MKRRLLYRVLAVVGAAVVAGLSLLPTWIGPVPEGWGSVLPAGPIRLGLDLQGGMHLVLEVQTEKAIEFSLERTVEDLKRELRERRVPYLSAAPMGASRIGVRVPGGGQPDRVAEVVAEAFPTLERGDAAGDTVDFVMTAEEMQRIREFAVEQSLETIRNRIDQLGLSEPIIQRTGTSAILVQLPGETDPERAKSILGRTAVLEFRLVPDGTSLEAVLGDEADPCSLKEPERSRRLESLSSRAGSGVRVLCSRPATETGRGPAQSALVEDQTLMTGEVITDARPRPDTNLPGNYLVGLDFNGRGADRFEEITGQNVGRQLAIILDDTLYSAPRIQERIGGGRAVITGAFSLREARDLSIVLRAGALPAPVIIAEERTVGPSLGRDSVRQGALSFALGGILVIAAMVTYYRGGGVLADVGLVLNIACLLALLAAFGATLTLPGIAGIVLTVGMAVDANVLIHERIREELRIGKTARAAVDAGYERALPAILDSNATTFLSGIILFQFGSGPIRGFAVTLCIGIVTTVFTAVFCTRVAYDYLLQVRRIRELSI